MFTLTCQICGSSTIATGLRGRVFTVCSECPVGSDLTVQEGLCRWRTWLIAHGIEPSAGPMDIGSSMWDPNSRTLLLFDPDASDDDLLSAMAVSARRGWTTVLLGHTLHEQLILYDSSLDGMHGDGAPLEERCETDWDVGTALRFKGVIPWDDLAIFGACDRCGHFQWHSNSGSWACRICDHYDGNNTLDPMTIHYAEGSTRCTTCAGLVLAAA